MTANLARCGYVTNHAAIDFYKKHGFGKVRTLRHYYANGNDAYLMVKQL